MTKGISFTLGIILAIWFSLVFPILFPYLFINVSLDPVVGGCLESASQTICTFLAAAFLWGMTLLRIPANVTGHSGDRDRFAHGHHAGVSFVL